MNRDDRFTGPIAATFTVSATALIDHPVMNLGRADLTTAIRQALRRRSGRAWSVKYQRGTASGWIRITAPPARLVHFNMTDEDCKELAQLLGLETVAKSGVAIPGQNDYRAEYLDRVEGRPVTIRGVPNWD